MFPFRILVLVVCISWCWCYGGVQLPGFRPPVNLLDNIAGVVRDTVGGISNAVKTIGGVISGFNRPIG